MARKKKSSSHYDSAVVRAAALRSIDPALDLGNGMTVAEYLERIVKLRNALDGYNTLLSQVDEKLNQVNALEKEVMDWSERMLAGVAARFGKNSDEYEMAGGRKKSERRRMKKKE
jgi:uncharacterized protein YukE